MVKNPSGDIEGSLIAGMEPTYPDGEGEGMEGGNFPDVGDESGEALKEEKGGADKASRISRKRRAAIRISFSNEPERKELSWLDGNLVIINMGHPSYLKVKNNRMARKIHNIFSIAVCLERELRKQGLLEPEETFVDRMMKAWGNLS